METRAGMLMAGEALLVLLTPHLCPEAVPKLSLAWAIRFAAVAAVDLQLMVWCCLMIYNRNCVEHRATAAESLI
jgi:hypothetical protein